MTTITPTSPAIPATIANLNPAPAPLGGGEYIAIVQNGVTYRVTAAQFAEIVKTGSVVGGNGIAVSTVSNVSTISLAALPSENILVGNVNNLATPVALSGDATLANTGALTLDTVNSNVGSYTNASITVNEKGLVTAASNGTAANYYSPGGFINKFRNAGFDVAQRGTSGTVTTGNVNYTLDGWLIAATGATISWAQSFGEVQTIYSGNILTLTGATSMTATSVSQRIESNIAASLASNTVTVQFLINVTGSTSSFTPTLTVSHAGSRDNWGSPVTDINAQPLQTCQAGATTIVAYTFVASANAVNGLQVNLNFGAALNSASNVLNIMMADIRQTPGASIGLNSSPPIPEIRPITSELPACQRYYNTGTYYGTSYGQSTSGTGGVAYVSYPATMRVVPTVALSNQSYTNASAAGVASNLVSGLVISATATTTGNTIIGGTYTSSSEL